MEKKDLQFTVILKTSPFLTGAIILHKSIPEMVAYSIPLFGAKSPFAMYSCFYHNM
jgi:hypothetical protein